MKNLSEKIFSDKAEIILLSIFGAFIFGLAFLPLLCLLF